MICLTLHMAREYVDFGTVPERQAAMHERLRNWATWVRPRQHAVVHPMFRGYRPSGIWGGFGASQQCDQLDAQRMEKAVVQLPAEHRSAIQWWYVFSIVAPMRVARSIGCSLPTLARYVVDGRTMLINRSI